MYSCLLRPENRGNCRKVSLEKTQQNVLVLKSVCHRGRVVKSAMIVIAIVSVQNLLAPLFYVLGKDTLRYFPCLAVLASSPKLQSYHCKKLKN